MFRLIRLCCCSGIPKSTKNDYFFDPRVATVGYIKFNSEKTQSIISDEEFQGIREEMLEAGGSDILMARNLYVGIWIFAIISLAWWIVRIVLSAGSHTHFSKLAIIISVVLTILINILLTRFWMHYMTKAAGSIQVMFEKQNRKIYNARGVSFGTQNNTLVYIHIRMFASQKNSQGVSLSPHKTKKVKETELQNA